MDPFSVVVHADGRRVRFFRSIDGTVASIADHDADEAAAYRRFMDKSVPIIRTVLPAVRGAVSPRVLPRQVADVVRTLRHQPLTTVRDAMGAL